MRPILISAANPGPLTGDGNNTWFIDGKVPTLIDAGVGHPDHLAAIENELADRPLALVLVTHGHADHASGAPALRARWPNVIVRKLPLHDDLAGAWTPMADDERIAAGDEELVVVATPGHARDHVCLWEPESGDLFSGDLVVDGGTVLIPGTRGGGLRAYLQSLRRLANLDPTRVFPGHGPIITETLDLIASYIAHRNDREMQVLACLADGVIDPDAIVTRVYPDLAPALLPAARLTVEAHLTKIAEDRTRG